MAENPTDIARSVLVTAIDNDDTALVIDGANYDATRFNASGNYSVALRDPITNEVELVRVSGRTSNTLTASARGSGTPATVARAWPVGTIVECVADVMSLSAYIADNSSSATALTGTYAVIPGSANDGTTYHCTDAPYYAVRVSGAWQWFIGGKGRVYPPAMLGSYSWINQGASTVSSTRGYLALLLKSTGAVSMRGYSRAYSGAKKLTVLIDHWNYPVAPLTGNSSDVGAGVTFGESVSAKQVAFYNTNAIASAGLIFQKWSSVSSATVVDYLSSAPGGESDAQLYGARMQWWQIEDDGTDLIARWSIDGQVWNEFDTRSRTDYIAGGPTIFGVMAYLQSGDVLMNVLSWKEE